MHFLIFNYILKQVSHSLLLLSAKQLYKEAFCSEVLCSRAPQQSLLRPIKLVRLCLPACRSISILSNTKSSLEGPLRSFPFLRWHMYFNTVSSPLWALTKGIFEDATHGSEIYCTERCAAKWDTHLKDNRWPEDSQLLRQDQTSLVFANICIYWMRNSGTFSGQNKYAYLTHPCYDFKIVPPRQQITD